MNEASSRRLAILEAVVRRHFHAWRAVVRDAGCIGDARPDVDHARGYGVPVVVLAAADHRLERVGIVLRQLLARVARVASRELRRERPGRNPV